jgi:hypothetical protein
MKEGQEAIWYITADSRAAAKSSPQLEIFRKKGVEVLLLGDRVDEWLISHLFEFEGHPLQSVAKGAVDLGKLEDEAEKKQVEEARGVQPTLARSSAEDAPRTSRRRRAWSIRPPAWSRGRRHERHRAAAETGRAGAPQASRSSR